MAFVPKAYLLVLIAGGLFTVNACAQTNSVTDPCAPILWQGETPWQTPVPKNIIHIRLDEVIAQVFSNSVTLQSAEAAVRSAQREVSIQRSAYWPSLTFETSWDQNLDGRGHRQPPDDYAASLSATWVLFDGFQSKLAVLKAAHERNATQYAELEVRRELHQLISTIWFAALLAQDRMDASQQDIFFNRSMLDSAIERYTAGVARRSDVLNFKVKLMEDVDTYFTQRLLFDSNITILEKLLQTHGVLSVDTHRLVDPYPDQMDFLNLDIEEQIRFARSARGDLLQQEEQIAASKTDVNLARGSRLPSITFDGEYSVGHESTYTFEVPEEASGTLGITLSWDLFSGFVSHHELIQAKDELLISELELEQLELDLREELTRLFKNFKISLQLYYNSALRLEAAGEDRKLVTLLYDSDLVAVTRLNEVQADSVHSKEQFIKSRVRVGEAWEAILISTGRMRHEALASTSGLPLPTEIISDKLFHIENPALIPMSKKESQ